MHLSSEVRSGPERIGSSGVLLPLFHLPWSTRSSCRSVHSYWTPDKGTFKYVKGNLGNSLVIQNGMVYLKPQCIQDMDFKVEDEQLRTNIHSFLYMKDLIPNYQNLKQNH